MAEETPVPTDQQAEKKPAPAQMIAQTVPIVRPAQAPAEQQPKPGPSLLDVINTLADRADPLVKLVTSSLETHQKGKAAEAKFSIAMALVAVSVVVLIIGVSAWLTYQNKIDGSTFTFLLGLIVGYVLTFIRDAIRTPES